MQFYTAKTYPSADCERDHLPVVYYISVKLLRLKMNKLILTLQYDTLLKD